MGKLRQNVGSRQIRSYVDGQLLVLDAGPILGDMDP